MDLYLFFNVITILEVIAAEFISIWLLSKRKHRFSAVLGLYLAITIALLLFMLFFAVRLPGYGNGSGRFMVLGAFYFIPALWGFGGDWKNRIIIAFYSFSYGLAIFALAVRIGYLFPETWLTTIVMVLQTLLYLLTIPFYIKFSREKVVKYVDKADGAQKNLLIRYTIVSFILIIAYNRTMTIETGNGRKLLVYVLLIYFIVLTYRLIVSYLKADGDNHELSELVLFDMLTGLNNRTAFFNTVEVWMHKEQPFYLYFMDLDDFKTINDKYGHSVGDLYLNSFAKALKTVIDEETRIFRIAGDEFICLSYNPDIKDVLEGLDIRLDIESTGLEHINFLGVSVGCASYPKDAEKLSTLMEFADKKMYIRKAQKKGE